MRWTSSAGLALLLFSGLCRADTLGEARALYKQGQFAKAAAKYEEAARERPGDPAVYWNEGFAYRKLGRYAEALAAFEKAGKLDPTHSFASAPGKYEQMVASTRRQAGGARKQAKVAKTSPVAGSLSSLREVVALKKSAVYVQEPNWARVNTGYLESLGAELKKSSGKPVGFLVSANDYRGKQLSRYAGAIYQAMALEDAHLFVASRAGVVAVTGPASKPVTTSAPAGVAKAVRAGDAANGLEQFARAIVK